MSDKQMIKALITNMTVNDDAFGVDPDSGDGIYIPPGVTRAAKLVAGEYREITVIPNNPERQTNTKWMGIFVQPPAAEPTVQEPRFKSQAALAEKILTHLESVYYLSTSEVAKELMIEVTEARTLLDKLFNERKLARADVHYGSNNRACKFTQ
jgi:hypothetical protein